MATPALLSVQVTALRHTDLSQHMYPQQSCAHNPHRTQLSLVHIPSKEHIHHSNAHTPHHRTHISLTCTPNMCITHMYIRLTTEHMHYSHVPLNTCITHKHPPYIYHMHIPPHRTHVSLMCTYAPYTEYTHHSHAHALGHRTNVYALFFLKNSKEALIRI